MTNETFYKANDIFNHIKKIEQSIEFYEDKIEKNKKNDLIEVEFKWSTKDEIRFDLNTPDKAIVTGDLINSLLAFKKSELESLKKQFEKL